MDLSNENIKVKTIGELTQKQNKHLIVKGFKRYNLHDCINNSLKQIGYKQPTPIQKKTIPDILNGNSVIVKSRTGSGKSAAFIIPILQKLSQRKEGNNGIEVVVLSPSRELAKQTLDFFIKLSHGLRLKFAVMTGGDKIEKQFERLQLHPDIIIATPGRLIQHLDEGSLSIKNINMLVIDEVDKLFESGFEEQIKQIMRYSNSKKQIALFSATVPQNLANFMKLGIQEYKYISLDDENRVPSTLKIHAVYCREEEKLISLVVLLKFVVLEEKTLIFCPTKHHCEYISNLLTCYGIESLFIYGKMEQQLRDLNLRRFKNNEVNILVVTDLAARGLDIPKLDLVINYDFPDRPKLFVHRIGRTARAENKGKVISLISPHDLPYFLETQDFLSKKLSITNDSDIKPEEYNEYISMGVIPLSFQKEVELMISDYLKNKIELDDLKTSMINSTAKKNKFKIHCNSKYYTKSKQFKDMVYQTSALLMETKAVKEKNENQLGDMLKSYKPQKTIFEHSGENLKPIEQFKNIISKNKEYKEKKLRELKEMEKEKEEDKNEDVFIETEDINDKNNKSILRDINKEINDRIKNNINDANNTQLLNKKRKRSQITDFQSNKKQFINNIRDENESKSLWGNEQPLNLDEITLNLIPDEDFTKKVSDYAWNEKLKKYVRGQTDKQGNLIKKNESGVRIKHDDKRPTSFKRWMSKYKNKINNPNDLSGSLKGNGKGDKKGGKGEIKSYNEILKSRKDKQRKPFKFAGQVRSQKEKRIGDKTHQNQRSMALVKKRGGFSGRGGRDSKGGRGGRGGRGRGRR